MIAIRVIQLVRGSQLNEQFHSLTVRDLFDTNNSTWKIPLLQNLFHQTSIQAIIQNANQPKPPDHIPDRLVWTQSKNGNFSFKIAYQIQAQLTAQTEQNFDWDQIWKAKGVMPKVKMFVWRALQEALPTMKQLHRRIQRVAPTCPRCALEDETVPHMLFFCPCSRATWFMSSLSIKTEDLPLNIQNLMEVMLQQLQRNPDKLAVFYNMMWEVWKSRNAFVFSGNKENPASIECRVRAITQLSAQQGPSLHASGRDQLLGFLPRGATCYGFADGSWDSTQRGGVGIMLYGNNGDLMHAMCQPIQVQSPIHAEIQGLIQMMRVIIEMQFQPPIVLATDAKSLVEFCNTGDEAKLSDWRATTEAHELRTLLKCMSQPVTLTHVQRERNIDAHKLANFARATSTQFRGYPTPQIISQLQLGQRLKADVFSF